MHVKEAIQTAKSYIADVFSEENVGGMRLEEVVFEERSPTWKITVSFVRPLTGFAATLAMTGAEDNRSLKVVEVDDTTGQVVSVRNRP